MQALPRISGRHYFAIFVLASATLSYQILITRFFSVMLYYHFAFAAISLAMLGLTRGAMEVYNKPRPLHSRTGRSGVRPPRIVVRDLRRRRDDRLPVRAARHSRRLRADGAGGRDDRPSCMPFTESGVCITLLLTRLPYSGGWLYAADLSGAALGCLGVIFVLLVVDPVSATLWIGAFAAGAGWIVVRGSGDDPQPAPQRRRRACAGRRGRPCTPDLTFPARAISASSGPRGPSRRERCSSAGIPTRACG